jgi:hypothetical protein
MKMSDLFLDALAADLVPVRRVRPADAFIAVGAALLAAVLMVVLGFGLRADLAQGTLLPIVVLRSGVLLVLGMAALSAVIAAARPGVGQMSHGWRWALGMAALFPVTSAIMMVAEQTVPMPVLMASSGKWCLGISLVSASLIGSVIVLWLRRGAPIALNRTGWLTGLAAGSFGTFAYALHCPSSTVHYIGIWYTLAVALCSGVGRLVVPRLIRW